MAKLFSAREIATLAMRKIGAVNKLDTAAPEGQLQVALNYLDTLLAEKAGTTRVWALVPQQLTFSYTASASSVNITSLLGDGGQLDTFRHAYDNDTDEEIGLMTRAEFEQHNESDSSPFSGSALYIASDGDDTYTAYLRPIPTVAKTIRITGQRFSTSVAASTSSSNLAHGFERAWQRWMINALSTEIGDGPLARLPEERLLRFERLATSSWDTLTTRRNGQKSYARFTKAWDG